MKAALAILLGCAALAGCAHYRAQPISPAAMQLALEHRALDDQALQRYVRQHLKRPAPPWDLDALTVAAWYYSPELDKVRARSAASQAAVITAGRHPATTLSVPFEYNTTPRPDESPYTLGLGLDIPVETAGKRGYRVAQARALSLADRFEIGAVAWQVRRRLRAQLLAAWDADARMRLLQAQLDERAQLLRMLEHRRALGEAASPELDAARAQAASNRAQLQQARREQQEALAAAAAVIGIPASALQRQPLDLRSFDAPARRPPRGALLDAALRNRADVQAQLARYEASQSALQLAVAGQYPDIHLGPGYTFDAGAHKLAFGLPGIAIGLPGNSKGPIAEAAAKRQLAASQVQTTVAAALAQVDRAAAAWQPAAEELAAARAEVAAEDRLVRAAAYSLRVGEGDRPGLLRTQLDAGAARLKAQQASLQLQQVAGAIEDAVQRPVLGGPETALERSP